MFLKYTIFAIFWALIVGLLCGLPGSDFPNLSLWALLTFDKFAHAFVYAVFSFLWANGFAKQFRFPWLRENPRRAALTLGILYGILIELMQGYVFVGRSMEFNDVIANSTGALIGIFIFRLVYGDVLLRRIK